MSPRTRAALTAAMATTLLLPLSIPALATPAPDAGPGHEKNHRQLPFEQILAELDDHGPGAELLMASHRGQWREHPENSLGAIDEAIRDGAEIVEIDVMITADGVPVLMHDSTVDRTTDGTGRVSDLSLAQIRELHLVEGLGGNAAAVTEHRVPTLAEAMAVVKGRALVNVDKAGSDPRVIEVLEQTGTFDHAIFKSGSYDDAVRFLEQYPDGHYMLIVNAGNHEQALDFPGATPFGFEVTFGSTDDPQAQPDYLEELGSTGRIWVNTMWGSLAAGNTDETSLRGDTDLGWGTVVEDFSASMIQTDNVEAFDYWREGRPLHLWARLPGANTVRVQAEEPASMVEGVGFQDNDGNRCAGVSPEHDRLDVCDQRGARVLGWIRGGEWVEYTLDITVPGTYEVGARVSSPYDPAGTVDFTWDGEPGARFRVANTTSHNAFEVQQVETRHFERGTHTFRISMPVEEYQNFNIDYVQLDRVG